MTKVQGWTLSLLAVIALAAGVLMMSGAVSSAQEGTATPAPTASAGTDDSENESATPEATDDADDSGDGGTGGDTEEDTEGDGHNCPEKDGDSSTEDDATGTSTSL